MHRFLHNVSRIALCVCVLNLWIPSVTGSFLCTSLSSVNGFGVSVWSSQSSSCFSLLRSDFEFSWNASSQSPSPKEVIETVISYNALTELLPNVWSGIYQQNSQYEQCVNAVASFMCAQAYPPCVGGNVVSAMCSSWGSAVYSACSTHPSWSAIKQLLHIDTLITFNQTNQCYMPADVLNIASSNMSAIQLSSLPSLSPPFLPSCALLSSLPPPNICANFLPSDYSYYSFGLNSLSVLPEIESGSIALDAFKFTMPYPSQFPCYQYYMAFLCTQYFPPCQNTQFAVNASNLQSSPTISIPTPQLVTIPDCMQYSDVCYAAILAAPSVDPTGQLEKIMNINCTNTKLITLAATAMYSTINEYAAADQKNITINSLQPIYQLSFHLSTYQLFTGTTPKFEFFPQVAVPNCPAPLNNQMDDTRAIANGLCQLPCAYIFFTDAEWTMVEDITYVFGSFSFALCTFLVVTWLVFSEKRKQRYVLWFLGCVWMLAFIFVVGMIDLAGKKLRYISCVHQDQQNYIDDVVTWSDGGVCVWQGIFFMYFSLAAAFWWMVNAVDLYLNVHYGKKQKFSAQARHYINVGYHCFSWVYPFFLTCLMFNWEGFGGTQSLTYCFITDLYHAWGLFFYQIGGALLIGFLAMTRVMWLLHQSALRVAKGSAPGRDVWKRHLRALAFIFEFLCMFIFIIAYNANDHFLLDQFTTVMENYAACLLGPNGGTALCGDKPGGGPNFGLWVALHIVTAGLGFFAFLVYGTQKQNYQLWIRLVKHRCKLHAMATSDSKESSDGDERQSGDLESRAHHKKTSVMKKEGLKHQRSHTAPSAATKAISSSIAANGASSGGIVRPNLSLELHHYRSPSDTEFGTAPLRGHVPKAASSSTMPTPLPTPSTLIPPDLREADEHKNKTDNDQSLLNLQAALETARTSEDSLNREYTNNTS